MALINTSPTVALDSTYKLLQKYVLKYINSGMLKSKFDVLEGDEEKFGTGIEAAVVLSATAKTTTGKFAEHGEYPPNVMNIVINGVFEKQYSVTVDRHKIAKLVNDDAGLRKYAAELVESLYQGLIDDKNTSVAAVLNSIINNSPATAVSVDLGSDTSAYAKLMLTTIKYKVADLVEGETGTGYGNSVVGSKRIAAEKIFIITDNKTAAVLDAFGYGDTFNDEYLKVNNVARIESARMPEGTVLVTDGRNIFLHKRYEELTPIKNSDGSINYFLNTEYICDAAMDATSSVVAYPHAIITTNEVSA